jgi:hypothetical protein
MTGPWRSIVESLGMAAHPEGGWYVETWRAPAIEGARPPASAILFLLAAGESSHWHRLDAAEVWQWSGGAPLELRIAAGDDPIEAVRLGAAVGQAAAQAKAAQPEAVPQAVVPAGAWQSARSLGDWTLVGCIVAPAFEFAGFELAPPDWEPGASADRP